MKYKFFGSLAMLSAFCGYSCASEESVSEKGDVQQELAANEEVTEQADEQSAQSVESALQEQGKDASEQEAEQPVQNAENTLQEQPEKKTEQGAALSKEEPAVQSTKQNTVQPAEESAPVINIEEGPQVTQIYPEIGWNRCMADTASNITQWKRWWRYLKMKEPIVINWINDIKIKIYPKNEVFRSIYVNGKYDPNMITMLNSFLKPGDTLIDVGANSGYISLPLVKTIGEDGKIIAIEPSTRDYKRLAENIALNKLAGTIIAKKYAMGDRVGTKTMLIASEERSGSNTLGMKFAFQGIEKETTEEVNVTTIDNIVEMENITRVDVIKLDVEGSEVRCLEGAKKTIEKFKPIIVLSVNSDALSYSKRSVQDLEKIFADNGYTVYGLEKDRFALRKLGGVSKLFSPIVVCLPAGKGPVDLPQPENKGFIDKIKGFFQ